MGRPRPLPARRHTALAVLASALCACAAHANSPARPAEADAFFDRLAAQAAQSAATPYRLSAEALRLPEQLKKLSYDGARDIRFRPDRALWRGAGQPFEVMFYHRGAYQRDAVRVHEGCDAAEKPLPYRPEDYDFGKNKGLTPTTWGDIGHAGWRAHFRLNRPEYMDELVSFLGASYFRALGAGQLYGASARGLALRTAGPGAEEFPRFTTFWLCTPERPAGHAANDQSAHLTAYALLDSPSLSGAYRFVVRPGADTTMDVRARLYARETVPELGIAPITSMFFSGENQPHAGDFRPEVHDSDGLMLSIGGNEAGQQEWIWRPLINPRSTLVTSFAAKRIQGFGLMQRDRAFTSYQDTEARYERRPSVWIEPLSDWGAGRVELLQLNAPDETYDNVTAYWVPAIAPLQKGQAFEIAYRLHWQGPQDQKPPQAWAVQSRIGHGWQALPADQVQYVVDFAGPALQALKPDAPVQAVVTAGANAEVLDTHAFFNDVTQTWRMTVKARWPNRSKPLELRGFLKLADAALTETWSPILVER